MNAPNPGRRRLLLAGAGLPALAAPGLLLAPRPSVAATFPTRPVRLVIPFPPGGGTDLVARSLADEMARGLGQPVIVENKPGGGTVIGSDLVAKAQPDGHTLLLTTSAHAINASLVKSLPYDTHKSFESVGLICRGPNMLVARADSPLRTVQDVLAAARAKPGKLSYGSSGNGTAVHLAGELFKMMGKVFITHVPYRGAGPAFTDLLGGQIDLMFATAAGAAKFVEAGKLRALAVTSRVRSPAWPDIPTLAESGLAGYEADVWYALFATGGTPPDAVARLNAELKRAVASQTFQSRVASEGLAGAVGTPAELAAYVRSEEARWRKVVSEGKVTID